MNKEEFIIKAKVVHENKYDYSEVKYVNNSTKICIICPEHGEFWQIPNSHLRGAGCPKCNGGIKLTQEEFLNKAKEIHGDKYDYSKVEYVNCKKKVCIICHEHGEFWQTPEGHYHGLGCPLCANKKRWITRGRITTKDFIKKAIQIHGNKFDYSKVEYISSKNKVCIICPEHGEFWQVPSSHLNGAGCPKCKGEKASKEKMVDFKDFLKKARDVHGNKFIYDESTYKGLIYKLKITCPVHGEFWQVARSHLKGHDCKKCTKMYMDKELFIENSKKVHGNKYDYSKVEYKTAKTPVCIICPKHGEFWQNPDKHKTAKQGCPKCNMSHLENNIMRLLEDYNIIYEYQKKFNWSKTYRYDFYLPTLNIVIECQGEQHFTPVDFAGRGKKWAINEFKKNIKKDKIKKDLCNDNNIGIYYINYNDENIKDKIKKIITEYDNKNNKLC